MNTNYTAEVATPLPLIGLPARKSAVELFTRIERLRLSPLATPIERADRLRRSIPGAPEIYIKRDDLTGYFGGGNKLRKLEYVMADVLAQGAKTVITSGSTTSNLARTTALVAKRLGLRCVLVLSGGDPSSGSANARITELLGVDLHIVATRGERERKVNEVAESLSQTGERVYKIPLGASNEVGSLGMVLAMEEMGIQQLKLGEQFDAIVFATSSGGTQAGLEAGKRLFGYDNLRLLGVSADDPSEVIKQSVLGALNPVLSNLGLPDGAQREELYVDDEFVGPGYGISSAESEEAASLFVEVEGILLDPVYTSKAAAGLLAYCREGRFRRTDKVLFWHTGGLLTLL